MKNMLLLAVACIGCAAAAAPRADAAWPILKTYDAAHQRRIRMPLGGIGTGTISLSGTGGLVDWEIRSRPDK